MIRNLDPTTSDLALTARTRVRIPENFAPARVFPGWGPGLGR
ncbi:MAG: hypothetical protein WAL67_01755 [Candidatus Cybelea sp.]|jgi:hypothetical protein